MKKPIFFFLLLLACIKAFSDIRPTPDSCVIVFGLTSNDNIPYPSKTIVFNNKVTGESISNTTDTLGKASFLLPKNTPYSIIVVNRSSEVANYDLTTPALKGLVKMNYDVQLDIFEENREGEIFRSNCFSNSDSLLSSDSTTVVHSLLTTKDKQPICGASVLFRNDSSREVYIGQTNENGKFDILLPNNQDFGVRLVDQGNRIPFINISTKQGEGRHSLNLNIDYTFSEITRYSEIIIKDIAPSAYKEEPNLFVLSDVLFDFDKATLRTGACITLNMIARKLKQRKFKTLEISGHTDSMGDDAYNLNLSDRRARAVMNYFIELGIDSRKMTSIGKGERFPVATNDTDEGRQQNRRTEIHILD